MLQLILGRSGAGKTERVYGELCDLAWAGRGGLILLVPEQFSFESERTLLARLGPRLAGRVQVLSFTRMAERVFREVGGLVGRRMNDATRALLMSRALELVADQLTLYRAPAGDPEAIEAVLAMTAEFKQCGVTPRQLEETAADMEEGALRRKTEELSLIFGAYEAVAAGVIGETDAGNDTPQGAYVDPMDDLTALADKLGGSELVAGAVVFVDSFKGFTAQELTVLRALMRRAETVTVTLCADGIEDKPGGLGLFSPVVRTAARLRDMAREDGVAVASPVVLGENRRTASAALKAAEAGCFAPRAARYEEPTDRVVIAPCGDIYAECDYVARSIRRRLREEGGRCREIAVAARNLDEYRGVLDAAMEKQGIPLLMDERAEILTQPLIALSLAALEAAEGFRTDDLLRLMKTGLCGFSTHSVALMENYALMWRVDGRRWREEWSGNPNGLSVKADAASDRQLNYLNRLRRRLVGPLERLRGALLAPGADGAACSKALYRYLLEVRADRLTRLRVARLERDGEAAEADRMSRLWELLMELLDTLAVTYRGAAVSPARYTALLRLVARLSDLGEVPQSLDAVQVGQADRMRFSAPKAVYIVGANEGVFPAYPTGAGLLSDPERRELIARGLPLSEAAEGRTAEERFFAYMAVAAPSEQLVVSYPRSNAAGETLAPSALVDTLLRAVPGSLVDRPDGVQPERAESERDAFDCAAALWSRSDPQAQALRALFEGRQGYPERLEALDRAAGRDPAAFRDPAAAKRFFGDQLRLSASRVEQYHRCRFAYFCKYGLKAEPRREADLDALAFGTVTHAVMERVLPEYAAEGFASVRRERAFADAADAVRAYAEETMGGLADKTSRFTALLDRLARMAGVLLWQVVKELRQSRFVPVDYELAVGLPDESGRPAVPPVTLTLPDGATVQVLGQVDRVDVYRAQDGTSYLRVVDYKTGSKEFRLSDVVEGINVQMLLYIFSLWQNGGERYGKVTPAGVLYLPAKLPVIQATRDLSGEQAERERTRALRMNGLLLDNPEIVRAMEHDAAGLFIPARLDKNGEFARGASVASLEQFGKLKKRMDALLVKMAETLRAGDVAACPAAGAVDACAWCDYRAACGHEPDDSVRFLAAKDAAQVFKELEEEDAASAPTGEK